MKGSVAHASGSLLITHLGITLQAERAIYDPTAKIITLDGAVRVERDGNKLTAVHATYCLDTQKLQVVGPNRTSIKAP
jgi:lipopolysaccharide export system protein LptA